MTIETKKIILFLNEDQGLEKCKKMSEVLAEIYREQGENVGDDDYILTGTGERIEVVYDAPRANPVTGEWYIISPSINMPEHSERLISGLNLIEIEKPISWFLEDDV